MARTRFFYGWKVVGCSVIGLACGWAAIGVFSFGAFIKPLEAEFGWQRGEISLALLALNLTGIVMSPLLGIVVDRHGVRKILLPSCLMLGVLVSSLYLLTNSLFHFYSVWFLVAVLGCATAPLSYSNVIVRWFDRRRGLALGIALAGVGLGAALIPPLAQAVITNYGWREAYLAIGGVVLLISLPLIIVFLRDSPEQMGLHPDGDTAEAHAARDDGSLLGYVLHEALRMRSFWLMVAIFFLVGLFITSVIVHLIPLLIERGVSPGKAATAQSLLGLSLIFGRVFAGHLMDRFFAPFVSVVFLIGPAFGLAILAAGASGTGAYVAVVLCGLAIGAEFDVMSYLTSRYFGLRSFGLLFGFFYAALLLGSAIGPVLMGYNHDLTGEYNIVLWWMSGAAAVAVVLTAILGPYPELPRRTLQPT
jgi:MFS family permease